MAVLGDGFGGSWRRLAAGIAGAGAMAGGFALAPTPLLFVCACTCSGGGLPANVPEAPWQPLLLIAGAAVFLVMRRSDGGAPPGPGAPSPPRRGFRVRRAVTVAAGRVAIAALVAVAGLTTASVVEASAPTAPAADCPCTTPAGGVQGTVSVPDSGAGLEGQLSRSTIIAIP